MTGLFKELIFPAGLLAALIMGAGIFSLPYLFSVAGVGTGFLYLGVFAAVFSVIHIMYSEVIRRTPGDHRFVGYAGIHLGRAGSILGFLTTVVGIVLVLLIYLVLAIDFIRAVFPGVSEWAAFLASWAVFSLSVASGIERLARIDVFITGIKLLIIVGVFLLGVRNFTAAAFPVDFSAFFLPYSAILFSLSGRSAISSIHQYLTEHRVSERRLKPALILGTFVPAILYGLFVMGVLGITGGHVTPDAVSGIVSAIPWAGMVVSALGLLSLWTAYTFLGFEAQSILSRDFHIKGALASAIVAGVPLMLYFLGFNSFLWLIGISGGVLLSLECILVISMWFRVARPRLWLRVLAALLAFVFVVAGIVELLSFIK